MFRKITTSLLLAAAALSAAAQDSEMGLAANERILGYTLTNDIDIKGAFFGEAGTYSLGVYMTESDLKSYVGCRIVGMRIAGGTDLGRSRTFLYTITDDGITATHEQNQRLYEGWNRVSFNGDGYPIEEGTDLFFGFDYVETAEMVKNEVGGIAATTESHSGGAILMEGESFYAISGVGDFCMQLIIDASNLPPYDLTYGFFDTGFKYKQKTEPIELMAEVRNVGRERIKKLRMAYQYDNSDPVYVDLDANLGSGSSYTWNQMITPDTPLAVGAHTIKVFPVEADGVALETNEENVRTENIAIYENTVPRDKVLLEVYTNSSSADVIPMNSIVNQLGDCNGMAIVATHHFPGTPLATKESLAMFQRYAYGIPVFTTDRAYFPGEHYIAYSVNDFIGVVPDSWILSMFEDIVLQDLYSPSFATLAASGSCSSDNSVLNLDVTVDALPEAAAIYGSVAVHVMLVEDGVKSAQSAVGMGGRPIVNNNYIHNNVVRLNHTGIKGQRMTLENNGGTVNFQIPLDAEWKPENMRVVVYLTKWFDEEIPSNLKDADVVNATMLPLGSMTAVAEVSADHVEGPSTFFTIGGVQVSGDNLSTGIYIERLADGTARKVLIK